jgi:hypothetical protein
MRRALLAVERRWRHLAVAAEKRTDLGFRFREQTFR